MPIRETSTTRAESAAMAGRRLAHFKAFSMRPAGRGRDRAALEPGPQVVGHGLGTWRTGRCGSFSRHFRQITSRSRGTLALKFAAALGELVLDPLQRVDHAVTCERRLAGEQRVEDRAQAVDVGGRRDRAWPAGGLLGGHVAGRAEDGAAAGQLDVALEPLGQSEVGDRAGGPRLEEDVGRLEVAVEDARADGRGAPLGHLDQQRRRGLRVVLVGRPAGSARLPPGTSFMREVGLAVVLADLVDRHDVGMLEQGDRLGLVPEPCAARRRRRELRPGSS